jgi:hypothetical protein
MANVQKRNYCNYSFVCCVTPASIGACALELPPFRTSRFIKLPMDLILHHAMKTYRALVVQLHAYLSNRCKDTSSVTPRPLYSRCTRHPLDRRVVGGPHSRPGHGRRDYCP